MFRHSAKTMLYPTISAVNRSLVAAVVTRSQSAGRLDYGNATLSCISGDLVQRLQSVMNAAARMIYSTLRFTHISPFLLQLHWLKARERIDYTLAVPLAVLVYTCMHGTGPT